MNPALLCYRYPRLVILSLFLIIASGLAALSVLGRQEDPSLVQRYGAITVIFPGASAERVEALVVEPLERALLELVEIDEINATARANVALLDIAVREDLNPDQVEQAWTLIRDRVAQTRSSLPDSIQPIEVRQFYLGAATLLVSLAWPEGEAGSLGTLSRLARDLEERLRAVPGTEETALYGDVEEEIRVELDTLSSAALGLAPADIAALLSRSDAKSPAGRFASGDLDLTVEVEGEFDTLDRVRAVPVADSPDGFLRLGDIARVERGRADPERAIALRGGQRIIAVGAFLEPGLQVDRWDPRARAVVNDFAASNPGLVVDVVFDQAHYVIDRLSGLARNLGYSALIVFVVLFLMMGWRAALIVGSALPLTVLLVMVLTQLFGSPLHQMSVTGLVVSLGLLIDNAIVVVDDYRLLRSRGDAPGAALEHVTRSLFGPLLASTLTTVLAFGPIALLPGSAGEFVSMIGVSVIFSVSASFLLSFTVIPALAAHFDDGDHASYRFWRDGLRSRPLAGLYRRVLDLIITHPVLGIGASLLLPVLGVLAAGTLPSQFFPPTERDMFQLQLTLPSGSSIELTRRRAEAATAMLEAYDGVEDVMFFLGESGPRVYYNMNSGAQGQPNFAQGFVRTRSPEATAAIVRDFQRAAREQFSDSVLLATPFEQGPPRPAPIELQLVGPDLGVLHRIGDELRRMLSEVPGVTYTSAELQLGEPVLRLAASEAAASRAGLRLADLADSLRGSIDGIVGGSVLEDVQSLPVRVQAAPAMRASLGQLPAIPLPAVDAQHNLPISIAAFGPLRLEPKTAQISRIDGERANPIYAFLEPFALPAPVLAEFQQRLADSGLELPPGYRIVIGGDAENQGDAQRDLMSTALPLFVLMIAAVVLAFNSFRYAATVFASGLLSAGLAMFGVWLFQTPLGFNAIIGSLGLIGLSINGTIVVLSALRADTASVAGNSDAIRETVVDSTRHILATTLTTLGGFAPLLIEGDSFWLPFAAAVAGGVGGSALLALLFAPAAFVLLTRQRARKQAVPATVVQ